MKTSRLVFAAIPLALVATLASVAEDPVMRTLTPVIFVEEIEPCLEFWVDRLGFAKTIEVPEGDHLGFVAVASGNVELMYQSRASLAEDIPALAQASFSRTGVSLYVRVDNLDHVKSRLYGVGFVFPERTTFYGAREVAVRAPCGTMVTFAEFGDEGH